jgi:hypothetical protein
LTWDFTGYRKILNHIPQQRTLLFQQYAKKSGTANDVLTDLSHSMWALQLQRKLSVIPSSCGQHLRPSAYRAVAHTDTDSVLIFTTSTGQPWVNN